MEKADSITFVLASVKRQHRGRGRPGTSAELRRPPNQTWRTFLHNHIGHMVSTDFFTVPTITMKVLFVFIVLEHDRRKVLHFNVTEHPTGAWTAQQIVEAFADRGAAPYLIRDRDGRYSAEVRLRIKSPGYPRDSDPTAKSLAESIQIGRASC